jgi:aspartate kinase
LAADNWGSRPQGSRAHAPFEKERGVTSVTAGENSYTYLVVSLGQDDTGRELRELDVYQRLFDRGISINLVKLHRPGLSFIVEEADGPAAESLLAEAGYETACTPAVSLVFVYAAGMRGLSGVMSRLSGALLRAGVPLVQTADGPDTVFCLVEKARRQAALAALREEFRVPPEPPRVVVQKFGGRSVGTSEARRLAAERVKEALEAGYCPVVVVSAIGRMGEPYATDTLLSHLRAVDPETEPPARERDMLMACGEIISTVIMAQTLKSIGLRAVALTGGQAGILTDPRYGDAQILDIDPSNLRRILESGEVDAVVVAGFQGVTPEGAITTLGRGGSDTTASALAAALGAEKVEIYTHVDGVMTADPEVVPGARTLPMVTYEEVCNMAHQGAKVLHPRAAEIAMQHQIPLWVKSSFTRSPGTLVAPLAAIQPPSKRAVTGVATIPKLVYFTLVSLEPAGRAQAEYQVYRALGEAGINLYLTSIGPQTSSFIADRAHAERVMEILREQGRQFELVECCEMVSLVALNMWDEPGFLLRIAQSLADQRIRMLQMADSEGTVSCLVAEADAARAVKALHDAFWLGDEPPT